jgi:hypothetical protein
MGRAFGPWMRENAVKIANCDHRERGAFFEVTVCDINAGDRPFFLAGMVGAG